LLILHLQEKLRRKKKENRKQGKQKIEKLIKFFYDATGNRVLKQVFNDKTNLNNYTATWYSRDASGNTLASYKTQQTDKTEPSRILDELNISGSNRLGILKYKNH